MPSPGQGVAEARLLEARGRTEKDACSLLLFLGHLPSATFGHEVLVKMVRWHEVLLSSKIR